jgi:colanic acid biosynthesis glycosyl transferase WcaI
MRILIYGINFAPELTGTGKYTGEFAEWLAAIGHQVRVVTAPPYYPDWSVWPGFSGWKYTGTETVASPAKGAEATGSLRVIRCPIWVPCKPSGLKRLIHLFSFALSSLPAILLQALWRPHVVWVVEPSILCAPGALMTARLCGARSWLHVQDFEIDAAFHLGMLPGTTLRRAALACERWLMRKFNRVSTISRRMLERALAKGVASDHLLEFRNWTDMDPASSLEPDHAFRRDLGLSHNTIVALYSGSMGKKQGLELLSQVAARVAQTPDLAFVFCGNGPGRGDLMARCEKLPNVRFLDAQPATRFGELLRMADIHLLPQREGVTEFAMPSKLTGMLASGRPVVATARSGTELADIVESCGLVVRPGDVTEFADAILRLSRDPALRARLGASAGDYAGRNFRRDLVLGHVESQLRELVDE